MVFKLAEDLEVLPVEVAKVLTLTLTLTLTLSLTLTPPLTLIRCSPPSSSSAWRSPRCSPRSWGDMGEM